jgi:hypothetical protein
MKTKMKTETRRLKDISPISTIRMNSSKRRKRQTVVKRKRDIKNQIFPFLLKQKLFAYTYLMISPQDIQTYQLTELNDYISKKNKYCDNYSRGITGGGQSMVINNHGTVSSYIILIMKYNLISEIEVNPALLKNTELLTEILGSVIVHVDKSKQLIGVFDVCLHNLDKTGYGSVIMNLVLSCIEINFKDDDYTIHLGVLLENIQFEKVAYLYTSVGFKDPYISDTDLFDNKYGMEIMFLTKNIHSYIQDDVIVDRNYNILMDLYHQYKNQNICSLLFQFDKSVIYRSRLFPYLGLSGIKGIHQPKELFREHGGAFQIIGSKRDAKKTIFKLGMETIAENGYLKYITGEEESVAYVESLYSFHTHPIAGHLKYNWIIQTPSSPDFTVFYSRAIKGECYFHAVITVEGMYLISLSKAFLEMYKDNYQSLYTLSYSYFNKFEYPQEDRQDDRIFTEELVQEHINKYFVWLNNVNTENMFHVQFFYWKNLTKQTLIEINYMSEKSKCYADKYSDI